MDKLKLMCDNMADDDDEPDLIMKKVDKKSIA